MKNSFDIFYITAPLLLVTIGLLQYAHGAKNKEIHCYACLALVDEIDAEVKETDPKKMIEVGSFRVDSRGNQDLRQVPLARSDYHLTEVFETICEKGMNKYGSSSHPNYGDRKVAVRTSSRKNKGVSLKNLSFDSDLITKARYACEAVLEDFDEEIMKLFKNPEEDVHSKLCVDIAGFCLSHNVTDFKDLPGLMAKETIDQDFRDALKMESDHRENEGDDEDDDDEDDEDDEDDDNMKEEL